MWLGEAMSVDSCKPLKLKAKSLLTVTCERPRNWQHCTEIIDLANKIGEDHGTINNVMILTDVVSRRQNYASTGSC